MRSWMAGFPLLCRMNVLRRILVGIDFSKCSAIAFREAARLAASDGAELRVVHMVHGESVKGAHLQTRRAPLGIRLGRDTMLEEFLVDSLGAELPAELSCQTFVAHRLVEFMRQVEAFDPDLLVLGQHGGDRGWGDEEESLAAICVRSAPCQLLLTSEGHQSPYRNVVAAIDFSEPSREALAKALEICRSDHARLHVVHVHCPSWIYFMNHSIVYRKATKIDEQQYIESIERQLSAFLKRSVTDDDDPLLEVCSLERSSAAAGIISYIEKTKPDLVVVGTLDSSKHGMPPSHSTIERLADGADCSVLAIKTARRRPGSLPEHTYRPARRQ